MSPSPRSATRPSLGRLAELLHESTAATGGSVVVTVRLDPALEAVDVGLWPVPSTVEHPADPLIGFLAPPSWDAIGLASTGRLHHLDPGDGELGGPLPPTAVRATVVRDRSGAAASVIDDRSGDLEVLADVPEGWVSDALARALGLRTPPPQETLSEVVEVVWLDRIASLVLSRPGSVRTWPELARIHPLSPPGRPLPAALLAVEATALDLESSWERMRLLYGGYPGGAGTVAAAGTRPPDGVAVRPEHWFDDGSFARWVQRDHPPVHALLPAVLDALPASLGSELLDALSSVDEPER
ncbi:hypothetical protein BH10ACT1_BH10ACT1_11000 [soil metagenome]